MVLPVVVPTRTAPAAGLSDLQRAKLTIRNRQLAFAEVLSLDCGGSAVAACKFRGGRRARRGWNSISTTSGARDFANRQAGAYDFHGHLGCFT